MFGLSQADWRRRLSHLLYESLGSIRILQLFDILVDFPDSLPAVRDVATCLKHTSLHMRLVEHLR